MRKLLMLLIFCLASMVMVAQENSKYIYCEIHTYMKGMGGKQGAIIDFGSKSELQNDKIYKDDSGQPLKFDSAIDAVNFMSNNGWELVQAYVFSFPVCNYVLKKKVIIVLEATK